MKSIRRITAVLMAMITIFVCCSFSIVSAEDTMTIENVVNETLYKGKLYIRNGGFKVLPYSQNAVGINIETDGIVLLESYGNNGAYKLTAVANGETRITYRRSGYDDIFAYDIIVDNFPKELKITPLTPSVPLNQNATLSLIDPYDDSYYDNPFGENNYNALAIWKSDNVEVVIVEAGELYPQSIGTAIITAEYDGAVYECNVTISNPVYSVGDVNMDGERNLYDVIEIAKHLIGMTTLSQFQLSLADFNSDGDANIYDAIYMAKWLI